MILFSFFRYELGSGTALLQTAEALTLNEWHTVVAGRRLRDGYLRVDALSPVTGASPGTLTSLNLAQPFSLGYVGGLTDVLVVYDINALAPLFSPFLQNRF